MKVTLLILLAALTSFKMRIDSSAPRAHLCGGEGEITEWELATWKNISLQLCKESLVSKIFLKSKIFSLKYFT